MTDAVHHPYPNEQELIRWGDKQTLSLPVTEILAPKTIQLVKVHRHIPESWRITLWTDILIPAPPAISVFDFTISFDLIIGSGSAQINLAPTIRCQSAAAAVVQDYNSLVTNKSVGFLLFDLPARDIQIICTQAFNNSGAVANVEIAALAAPRYTPPTPGPQGGPQPEHPHEWMGPGFTPEPLRYR